MELEKFINKFGVNAIVKEIGIDRILEEYTSDEIMWELDDDEMADYLDDHHYDFSRFIETDEETLPLEEYSEMDLLTEVARRYKCRPFITKDDLKELICGIIDDIPSFCIDL